ncbi:beta strand repeat-containing protein [Archangium primigenium]|uniref:beta strand repeat-containing protein n=1 Tax=[Archangium] primigenium TaxID=2792470 RepID=UPI00195E7584|nr:hypothetical protein [Archangium primigenium]MBM7117860.1 hypothetical protein [Archangium primigenium]
MRMSFRLVMTLLLPLALARCGDPEEKPQPGVTEYTVGGTVTGLKGSGLVLRYGDETLGVPNDGSFTFARKAVAGTAYAVSVETQPSEPPQACTVTNGSGTLGSANVTDVTVTCGTAAFKVGGTVTGLVGTGLKLKNGTETLNVAANGAFQFATPLETGVAYAVTVSTQPTGPAQRCTVSGGEGIMGGADVTSVTVNCDTSKFTVGGTVSGLNGTLVLGNGTQEVTLTGTGSSANTSFAFPTGYETGTAYDVKVKTAPAAQDCTVTRGTGTVGSANVTNVAVACVTRAYLVNVTVSGLVGTLVVKNNDTDSLTFTTNETKAFNNRVTEGGTYFVTVGTQPATQTCTSEQAAAAPIGTANVTVKVTCVTNQYSLGGSVSGLGAGESVTLANGTQETTVSTNGAFQFAQKVDQGAAYTVTVKTAPAGKQCGVSNGTGTVGAGDVTNVSVVCSASTYTVGGNLSGLGTGGTVKLRNNGGDELTLTTNGAFTFATSLPEGGSYAVTVSEQPAGQSCTVQNGTGSGLAANVTNVAVTCANLYTVGGTVTGLSSGKTLVLTNNGGNDLTVTGGSTTFTFSTGLASGAAYAVAVKTQPAGLTCAVSNGSGTIASANVTNVTVTCTVPPARVSVVRVGDGTTPLTGGAAAAVNIDTYDVISGTRIGSVPVTGLTLAGSSGSEGFLSRSVDGRYVVLAGYSAAAGTAGVAGTTSSVNPRVVGRVGATGNGSVVASLNAAFSTGNVRSATTVDGTAYWVAGTGATGVGGIHYVTGGSTGASTQILANPNNSRVTAIYNGQLYLTSGSGTFITVSAVGTGTPTTSGQTATGLSGVAGSAITSPYQFFFLNDSTLYVADDGNSGGVFKYTKNSSGNWTSQPVTNPGPAVAVTALVDGTTVRVVATLKGVSVNKLVTYVDDGTTTATVTTVDTAAANFGFRGVAVAPN